MSKLNTQWQFTRFLNPNGSTPTSMMELVYIIEKSLCRSLKVELYGVTLPGAAGAVVCHTGNGPNSEKHARLIAMLPELMNEHEKADQIIRNAMQLMTTEQKREWGLANERDDVDGDGISRANERMSLLANLK